MNLNSPLASHTSPQASKDRGVLSGQLTFFDLWSIGVASLVGAGIFVLTGVAAGHAGPALFLSFLIAGTIAILTALSFAELAGMFPNAGASYVYCREAFSTLSPRWGDFVSVIAGWTLTTQYVIVGSAVWLGFGLYARYVYAGFSTRLWAILIGLLTTFLLYFGLKLSRHLINGLVLVKLAALVVFIVLGMAAARMPSPLEQSPFLPYGVSGMLAAAALLAFGQTHIDAICMLAEEARNPRRDVPLATISAIVAVVLLYALVGWTSVRIVAWSVLPKIDAPLATAMHAVLSTHPFLTAFAPAFIAATGIAATATSGIGCLLGAPRVGLAMARDGKLPRVFATIHPRFQSPSNGTLLLGLTGVAFTLSGNLTVVASAGVFAALVVFVFVNLSVLILRKPQTERPFRIPLSVAGLPIPCVLALLGVAGELFYLSPRAVLIGLAWLASGLVVYFKYRDKNTVAPAGGRGEHASIPEDSD
jgi:APA family basic amino acid/polyamine antiporter